MENFSFNTKVLFIKLLIICVYVLAKLEILYSICLKILNAFGDLYISPLPLAFAVIFDITSEKIALIITVLIYSILVYQISPMLIKTLFGDIIHLKWIQIIIAIYTCIIFYLITYMLDYSLWIFAFLLLSGIVFGKLMLDSSDMKKIEGSIPTLFYNIFHKNEDVKKELNEIKCEYENTSNNPWIMSKIIKTAPVYAAGLVFTIVCFFLGILVWIFVQSSTLFLVIIFLWIFKDIHYLFLSHSHNKFEKKICKCIENMKRTTIEELIATFTLRGNRGAVIKQLGGFLCFILSFFTIASYSTHFIHIFSNFKLLIYEDIGTFTVGLMYSIYGLSFILVVFFQLYFIYVLITRFPCFLHVWKKQIIPNKVFIPRLPVGGFALFIFNTILINSFLISPTSLLYLEEFINYFSREACGYISYNYYFIVLFLKFFILILLLFFEIYLLFASLKNRNEKEINPENLNKDNIIIPFAATFQWFSFSVIPYSVTFLISYYGGLTSYFEYVNLNRAEYLQIILNNIAASGLIFFTLTMFFYSEDIKCLNKKKFPSRSVKYRIIEYAPFFAITFVILIYGFLFNETMFYYLGGFATAMIVVVFIIIIIYDKTLICKVPKPLSLYTHILHFGKLNEVIKLTEKKVKSIIRAKTKKYSFKNIAYHMRLSKSIVKRIRVHLKKQHKPIKIKKFERKKKSS